MTFGLLGDLLYNGGDVAHNAISSIHRVTDDTLDNTGLSAFIPPAIHEVSDGAFGLAQRGVRDVGHTSGSILKSFEQKPLHQHDKSIGGNLKTQNKVKLCVVCKERPRAGDFKYCSKECEREDRGSSKSKHSGKKSGKARAR